MWCLLNKFANLKITRGTKIAHKGIKEMHVLIFENTLYFLKKSVIFFICKKISAHIIGSFCYLLDPLFQHSILQQF